GYVDAWPSLHGLAEGWTGMWGRHGCSVPDGYLYKRIDYAFSKNLNPVSTARFGMVQPGRGPPSDHAGLIAEYPQPHALAGTVARRIAITSPASGATVGGTVHVTVSASDDVAVSRVELLVDGSAVAVNTISPFSLDWDARTWAPGPHTIEAAATDRE